MRTGKKERQQRRLLVSNYTFTPPDFFVSPDVLERGLLVRFSPTSTYFSCESTFNALSIDATSTQ